MEQLNEILLKTLPLWAAILAGAFVYAGRALWAVHKTLASPTEDQARFMKDRVDTIERETGIFKEVIERQRIEIATLREAATAPQKEPPTELASAPAVPLISSGNSEAIPEQIEQSNSPSTFGDAIKRFEAGDYAGGMELIRKEAEGGKNEHERIGSLAFGHLLGLTHGSPEGLSDLQAVTRSHPDNLDARIWLAYAQRHVRAFDDAIRECRTLITTNLGSDRKTDILLLLARCLEARGTKQEAIDTLREAIAAFPSGVHRGRLYKHLGELFEEAPSGQEDAWAQFECALDNNPDDHSLRFHLAYSYSEAGHHSLAMSHYQELISREPGYASASNNAGVAAQSLGLPLTAVSLYRTAAKLGETLPSANLALLLIEAGFVEEAQEILDKARKSPAPHANIMSAFGAISTRHEKEETARKELVQEANTWTAFIKRVANALIQPKLPEGALVGAFVGHPYSFVVLTHADGHVGGELYLDGDKKASLTGSVEGTCVRLEWEEVAGSTGALWSFLTLRQSGNGILILEPDKAEGFRFKTGRTNGEAWRKSREAWVVSKFKPGIPAGTPDQGLLGSG